VQAIRNCDLSRAQQETQPCAFPNRPKTLDQPTIRDYEIVFAMPQRLKDF
jgi:hypothetical protein